MNTRYGIGPYLRYVAPIVLLAGLLITASVGVAAIFGSGTGEVALGGGRTVIINAHGVCQSVTNNNGPDQFVPTNTPGEWQSYRDYAPNKSLAACDFWQSNAGRTIPCQNVWSPGYPTLSINGVTASACFSNGYPQGVYAYAAIDPSGLPWIRMQGNCYYYAEYRTFDTGWVQTTSLTGQGYCPVGFGWLNNATAALSSSGFEVHSWYGGSYHGSFFMDWNGGVSYPPDPNPPPPPGGGGGK